MAFLRSLILRIVAFAGKRPVVVLALAGALMAATWGYATKLELRPDFLELLPTDSPGFKAYLHQLGRVGGGATFNFVVESPDRAANERFVDALGNELQSMVRERESCEAKCGGPRGNCGTSCSQHLVAYVESGTKDLQSFYRNSKWLFASKTELEQIDSDLERQIAIRSGLVSDLLSDPVSDPALVAPKTTEGAPALGLDAQGAKWDEAAKKHDDFPGGYFASDDGKVLVVRVISRASGTGGASGDTLLAQMDALTKRLGPARYHPEMTVGYAGDIPNAKAEKDSIASEALGATVLALLLVLGGIVYYFRSLAALAIVALPAFLGIGAAYAFATATFGYVNTAGAFLGAIILGNGINYPIVLLSRYQEFRALGMSPEEARGEAVLNAFRAELVGAAVAGIAYGSLTVTRFRGFSQFGTIGFFGMLFVWVAIVPLVPAMVSLMEMLAAKFPRAPSWIWGTGTPPGPSGRGFFTQFVAKVTSTAPRLLVVGCILATLALVAKLPGFLKDPWEYNFHALGSKQSHSTGAGIMTTKADSVFRGKLDISGARMLADAPEQVAALKAKMLANDAADPQGKLLEGIVTIDDFLPGTATEQAEKLTLLTQIRERLTPRVLESLTDAERDRVAKMTPPTSLKAISGLELSPLIRRRFEENDGRIGTLFYVQYKYGVSVGDGRTVLRLAKTTDNVVLNDGVLVQTASRASVYAEMIRSITRDGPLATVVSFLAVAVVVILATHRVRGAVAVLTALVLSVLCTLGIAALSGERLNFLNFIALPITFGIGCEYPFNIFDRARLLKGDVRAAVVRSGGAVALCSYTTIVGYGSLLIADQQAVNSFGRVAALGELACIVMALFFLPSLLHIWRAAIVSKKPELSPPAEQPSVEQSSK
jgi:uncharacterized protein